MVCEGAFAQNSVINDGETVYRLCGMDEETACHIIFDCEAFTNNKCRVFGFKPFGKFSLDELVGFDY